jgi:periplasmic divalent cation tolerance protein
MSAIIILSTASKLEEAERIAQALVEEKLAACVNLLPQIDSRYWWDGEIQSGQEVLMIIKTLRSRFKAVEARIKALHSYTVPEILAIPVALGSRAYLQWMARSVEVSKPKLPPRNKRARA